MKLYQIINPYIIPESRDPRRPTNLDTIAQQQYNIAKNQGLTRAYPKIQFYEYKKRTGETKAGFVNPATKKWILTPGHITAIIPAKNITNPPTYYIQTLHNSTYYYYTIQTNPALIKNLMAARQAIKYYQYDHKNQKYTIKQSPISINNKYAQKTKKQLQQQLNKQWATLLKSPEGADYINSLQQANQLLYKRVHTAFNNHTKNKKTPQNPPYHLAVITTQIEEHQKTTDTPDEELKEQYQEAVIDMISYYCEILELYQMTERRDYILDQIKEKRIQDAIKKALNDLIKPDADYIDPLQEYNETIIYNQIQKQYLQ